MKKHLIMSVLALAIMASASGAIAGNVIGAKPGGDAGAGSAVGGGGVEARAADVRAVVEPNDAVSKFNDVFDKFQTLLEGMFRGQDAIDRETEHADGHERQVTGKGDERPEEPAPTNDRRTTDSVREAHDAHEVHVHEPEVHEPHEAPIHEPFVHEANAGKRP